MWRGMSRFKLRPLSLRKNRLYALDWELGRPGFDGEEKNTASWESVRSFTLLGEQFIRHKTRESFLMYTRHLLLSGDHDGLNKWRRQIMHTEFWCGRNCWQMSTWKIEKAIRGHMTKWDIQIVIMGDRWNWLKTAPSNTLLEVLEVLKLRVLLTDWELVS